MVRIAAALVGAPLAVWAVVFVVALLLDPNPAKSGLIYIGPLIGLWLLGIMIVVGLPLVVVFRRYGWARAWPFALIGALTGLAMLLLIAGTTDFAASFRDKPVMPAGFALVGMAIGSLFWLIGIRANSWFATRESRLEAQVVRAAAALNANAYEAGRSARAAWSRATQAAAPVLQATRRWSEQRRQPPVFTIVALVIPVLIFVSWASLEHANLRALGHAAMGVYVLMVIVTGGAVIAGVCLAVVALARRERFWLLAVAGMLANLAVAARFL